MVGQLKNLMLNMMKLLLDWQLNKWPIQVKEEIYGPYSQYITISKIVYHIGLYYVSKMHDNIDT